MAIRADCLGVSVLFLLGFAVRVVEINAFALNHQWAVAHLIENTQYVFTDNPHEE